MMRPSGVLTRFTAYTDYQVRRKQTKKKESVNAAHPDYRLLQSRSAGCLDITKSGVVNDIALLIDLSGQLEVELSWGDFASTIGYNSVTAACFDVDFHLLHRGSSDCRDIAVSSGVGATVIVHDIAVIIDLNPAPTAADMRIYVGAHKNHMCVFLSQCGLSRQIEVELSGLARLRLGVGNRCFNLSTDNESGLVSGNSQAIAYITAVGICLDNL